MHLAMPKTTLHSRPVDDHGETLEVGFSNGLKVLVDPCFKQTTVVVPSGRRAKIVCYSFSGRLSSCGRDAHVVVQNSFVGLGFTLVGRPELFVLLQDLSEGQRIDVLPAAEPASAYAVVRNPLPVLFGAATVQPVYAALAA